MNTRLMQCLLPSMPLTFLLFLLFGIQNAKISQAMPTASAQIRLKSPTEALGLYQQGVQQYRRGDLRTALETFNRSLIIVTEEQPQQRVNILNYIGKINQILGQDTKAIEYYQEVLTIIQKNRNSRQNPWTKTSA